MTHILSVEYARLGVVKNIEFRTTKIVNPEGAKSMNYKVYELKNILERFLIRLANLPSSTSAPRPDSVFAVIPEDHIIYRNLVRELKEKGIQKAIAVRNYVKKSVDGFLQNYKQHSTSGIGGADVAHRNARGAFVYKKFIKFLPTSRARILSATAKHHGVAERDVDQVITTMLIRYDCLLPRGQQWNIPFEWYKNMEDKYGIGIELFASPINNQIALVYDYYDIEDLSGIKYGSLFPDTDAVFGSIGNVITNLENVTGTNVIFEQVAACDVSVSDKNLIIANPPYVEELMDGLVDVIHEWMSRLKITIILNVPEWTDAKFYSKSLNSPYLVYDKTLMPGTYHYENSSGKSKKVIPAKFKTHLFVFSTIVTENPWNDDVLTGYV